MAIAKKLQQSLGSSSLIRQMFEEGERRKALYGEDKVFDFSLGNPVFEPPKQVKAALQALIASDRPGQHRYMPNAGLAGTRSYLAGKLALESGLEFGAEDVVMTVGAGGALNVILKTLLDPGDEVLVLRPYFVEYDFYIDNHGGVPVSVPTLPDFTPDLAALAQAINPKTKALLINSPNNPTGVVYSAQQLAELGALLEQKSRALGHPIHLISDEPYRAIVFDRLEVPSVFKAYPNCILATSSSKDLALPGERIGYLAVSPRHQDRALVRAGTVLALRTLGFVNAPALMQRMLPLVDGARVDLGPYQKNRDLLYDHLRGLGLECVKPGGAFYLFPKAPIEDDLEFVKAAQELNLLLVPGSAFRLKGYFRIAYCFETAKIEASLPVFERLVKQFS
ncbi:MAG: aspartate aminotransferase [Candidatus Lambdaproteobacteria bacterium RIFOXYD1_FULL_56_27]|uniref:Aspartate aminotransferase n=1 Tax=Candidatus Lambdaproteobacteria bacterium RIFOXYD2_FULL_56_26 TaxID=1817773 RepID=A0A1F6GQD1_9PROT|nr:MAG: aspartate aminotransferase [Candidatus Lambdaproteobacteria bacterium RIFOXYD2_FULL_56_26]OGH04111.1 MAG: aspartate aminotransferase [Candidatus Lambdaproteobacteria bacterium RIFOXYC1_FULL_56_13]OGH06372.1 MAG: aspartate aminotransferase [Candidatus Lambdaproteobacteria bacterium RIFOXYD1_FULL_56_27]